MNPLVYYQDRVPLWGVSGRIVCPLGTENDPETSCACWGVSDGESSCARRGVALSNKRWIQIVPEWTDDEYNYHLVPHALHSHYINDYVLRIYHCVLITMDLRNDLLPWLRIIIGLSNWYSYHEWLIKLNCVDILLMIDWVGIVVILMSMCVIYHGFILVSYYYDWVEY